MSHAALISNPEPAMTDIGRFTATPLMKYPFDYILVPGFLRPDDCKQVLEDYPAIEKPGSFPLSTLRYGAGFGLLIEELKSDVFRKAVEDKFSINLTGRPTMITVRGMCAKRDGKIHTDTESKIITLLIYMNPQWEKEGGRLRLLRSRNLDDMVAEVPPDAGTLLMFRRADNSFHGHKSFVGPRKVIQMNWVTEQKFADRNMARHGLSSFFKRLNPFGEY